MRTTRSIKTILACALTCAVAAASLHGAPADKGPAKPRVEVVFVLDTTGSMSGLIAAAKEKIWAIANTLATAKPAPEIKMGLVAYRDRGDAYVTKLTDLSDDLDAVYTELMAFQAQGGGDTPESVNQALHEAVTRVAWSTDDKTYRVIFLVGDCPPHMDYPDDVKFPETCKLAAERAITINSIQCGNHGATPPIWTDIATRAEGRYFRVEQSGGAILASTPFDAELATLSRKLDGTRVYYGSAGARAAQTLREVRARAIYKSAPEAALARRASFSVKAAGAKNFLGEQELVQAVANGKVQLEDVKEDQLPEPMKKMSLADRKKLVAEKAGERKALQSKIKDLSEKRQRHIEGKVREMRSKGKGSLDAAIFDCIKSQAGKQGMALEAGPEY